MKKKLLIGSLVVLNVTLIFSLLYTTIMTYEKMLEVSNQLVYLQDTNTVIQRELEVVVNDFEEKLKEEASLVENYQIDLDSVDFENGTYKLNVSVIPKEYTDNTKISIFFGAEEYPLARDGFSYRTAISMLWGENFDGNVTLLFSDGKKRNTEVLAGYEDVQEQFDYVLSGDCEENFTYQDGKLLYEGSLEYILEGRGNFRFDALEFVLEQDGEILYTKNLLVEESSEAEDEPVTPAVNPFTGENESTETETEEPQTEVLPIYGLNGSAILDIEQELPIGGTIRGYLRAVSVEGYTFEYTLVSATLEEESEFEYIGKQIVIDTKGGRLE